MKRQKPRRKQSCTRVVWKPRWVLSEITDDHQLQQTKARRERDKNRKEEPAFDKEKTRPRTVKSEKTEASRGKGEGPTKKKGCFDMVSS